MTTAAPAAPDQLEELLGDHDKIQAMLADDPDKFRSLIAGYVKNVNDRDRSIRQQVDEQVQATLADFMRETGAAAEGRPDVRPDNGGRDKGQGYNRHALGAKELRRAEELGRVGRARPSVLGQDRLQSSGGSGRSSRKPPQTSTSISSSPCRACRRMTPSCFQPL